MEFRPCIDIHNGKVKQIVGGSLTDKGDYATENFVSCRRAKDYADLYRSYGLAGGHIILLNSRDSEYYDADLELAREALTAWPGGLQIGGGIDSEFAPSFIEMGASHVIVTSYVFTDGQIRFDRLRELVEAVGKEHIVLDLSCRKKEDQYFIVTDRWQKYTRQPLDSELFDKLSGYCDEFLVHAVNVEGTASGVDTDLLSLLAKWCHIPITYAGGIGSMDDIHTIEKMGAGNIHFTVGSALDLFGGSLKFEDIVTKYRKKI